MKRNPRLASDIESTLHLLSEDAFDARLKTHKLKGGMEDFWACSAGYDLRIVFEFGSREGVAEIVL